MLVHTRKPRTKRRRLTRKNDADIIMILVSCPIIKENHVKQYLERHGCFYIDEEQELSDARGLFARRTSANMLMGARGKEGITQIQLSKLTGIPRRHISDMENGRRPIGKQNALKFEKALNISYRLFL